MGEAAGCCVVQSVSCRRPCGCTVFQGAPKPCSQAAGQFEVPDTAIEGGAFKDGKVTFSVTREFNGNKVVAKYSGKLSDDAIKGSIELSFGGKDTKVDDDRTHRRLSSLSQRLRQS